MTARLIVINTVFVAAMVWAWFQGFVTMVFDGDHSRACYGVVVIVMASIIAAFRGFKVHLLKAAWLCETLGFGGTILGISQGFRGADLTTLQGIIAAGNAMYAGMGTAFLSTIAGFVGMLWLWGMAQAVGADAKA